MVAINPNAYAYHSVNAYRCGAIVTKEGLKQYNGWIFLTFSGIIQDCWLKSPHLIRALEVEGGDGGRVINFNSVNGIIASNSSWNATFRILNITLTKGAAKGNPALLSN